MQKRLWHHRVKAGRPWGAVRSYEIEAHAVLLFWFDPQTEGHLTCSNIFEPWLTQLKPECESHLTLHKLLQIQALLRRETLDSAVAFMSWPLNGKLQWLPKTQMKLTLSIRWSTWQIDCSVEEVMGTTGDTVGIQGEGILSGNFCSGFVDWFHLSNSEWPNEDSLRKWLLPLRSTSEHPWCKYACLYFNCSLIYLLGAHLSVLLKTFPCHAF